MRSGLLDLARPQGNVAKACEMLGYSRGSFYRLKQMDEAGGEGALREISRRKPVTQNRVMPEVEEADLEFALEQPDWGQGRVSNALRKDVGASASPFAFLA